MDSNGLKATVKERYGQAARQVSEGEEGACCGTTCCGGSGGAGDPITSNLYSTSETAQLPAEAFLASLGCGNPTALTTLNPGDVVLDLGSGGGIDVLLSARRVGPEGKAYGLDMTDEMLELARANAAKAGATNVEFLMGEIEEIPLPDNSVDVIISNCVINLSGDKRRVLHEAFRVLRPGGRFAVSDIIYRGDMPEEVKQSMDLWTGCVAGALEESEFRGLLAEVGFQDIDIEPTRIYGYDDAVALLTESGLDAERLAKDVEGRVMSAFIKGEK